MNTCHHSSAVSQSSGTGAAPHLRPTRYSCTSHDTALSATRRSPIAAPGAAHAHLHGTHGPHRAAPATATWTRLDPATATVALAHPARDGTATPPHGFQITAATQPHGAFSIATTTTATVLIAVTFPIDPAGAPAMIDTVTTVAVATTRTQHGLTQHTCRATPSPAAAAVAIQRPVSTAPPMSPHGAAHWVVPGHTAPAPAVLHDVLCTHAHAAIRATPPHTPRMDVTSPCHVIVFPAALGATHVPDPAALQRIMMTILPTPRK